MPLDVKELPPDLVRELDELDLNSILSDELAGGRRMFDAFAVSIALRRLAQLEDPTVLDVVLDNLDQLVPVLPQVINFIRRVTPSSKQHQVGGRLISTIASGLSSHLEYQRTWMLTPFTDSGVWGNVDPLVSLVREVQDDVARPMLTRALGVAGQRQWFRHQRRQLQNMSGWQRRSFLLGSTCTTCDEYTHWMKSILTRLDLLDRTVAKFCLDVQTGRASSRS